MTLKQCMEMIATIRYFELRMEVTYGLKAKVSVDATAIHGSVVPCILDEVTKETGVSVEQMKSPALKHELMNARFYAYRILSDYTLLSITAIGRLLNREHSTILYGLKRFDDLYFSDRAFREKYIQIKRQLEA